MPTLSSEVMDVVESQCSVAAIDKLLRDARQRGSEVRLSASNKAELIRENLRQAVATNAIPLGSVLEAVADAEEHRPHLRLFYNVSDNSVPRLRNAGRVAGRLLGEGWESRGYPLLLDEPDGEVWGDFQPTPDGWRAKMYRGGLRWTLDREQSYETDDKRVRTWVRLYQREVWCVNWSNSRRLLTLSLPNLDTKNDFTEARAGIWHAIEGVIAPAEVSQASLQNAALRIAQSDSGLGGEVRVGATRLMNSRGGSATFAPHSEREALHSAEEFVAAARLFNVANEIVVHWQPTTATDAVTAETRTVVGHKGVNGVLFSAESNRKTVDHVVKRLHELNTP